jgi:hypothetical protein
MSNNENDMFNDDQITFTMAKHSDRIKLWKKVDIEKKLEYWTALQTNYHILKKQNYKVKALDTEDMNEYGIFQNNYNESSEFSISKESHSVHQIDSNSFLEESKQNPEEDESKLNFSVLQNNYDSIEISNSNGSEPDYDEPVIPSLLTLQI